MFSLVEYMRILWKQAECSHHPCLSSKTYTVLISYYQFIRGRDGGLLTNLACNDLAE